MVQPAKKLVWDLWQALEPAPGRFTLPNEDAFARDVIFHGPAPIGDVVGRDALFETVYAPLARAFPVVQRRPYLFLGGLFEGNRWVAKTGDMTGRMTGDWLGIPATGDTVHLRFGEFYRLDGDRIAEIRCLFDILGVAAQAGFHLLPPFQGRAGMPPGPAAGNGLSLDPQHQHETEQTLALVEAMVGGCNQLDAGRLESMGMEAFWHPDMVWHGPWGVGSCHGFREFQDFAQGPSVASFPDRRGGTHRARIAEGITAAFTGGPSLQGTFTGAPFRGLEPTGERIGMNLMDFYVRRGDKLAENWVLIDFIDFWAQCGVDLMKRLER